MKKLIAMAIVLCMVIGMIPMIAMAADTKTIYFDNSLKNWSEVNVYYWGGTSTVLWPGVAMTKIDNTTWSYEVPGDATKIIFNNGSTQTSDLEIPTDGKNMCNGESWTVRGSSEGYEEIPKITVYYDNSSTNWSSVSAYCWGGYVNGWPGEAMTKVEGNIWSIEINESKDPINIIFNNNGNGAQTADLKVPTDGNNCWNGSAWVKYPYEGGTPTPPPAAPELSEEKITVYAKSPFAVPHLYGWVNASGTYDTAWPGVQMTQVGSSAWYSAEISKSVDKVIINGGQDQPQTGDLTLDPAKPWLVVVDTDNVVAFATQAEADAYVPGSEPVDPPAPPAGNAEDFYLVGYINGADHGTEGDAANLGNYKFVDGKLTATFTADSYVFVKTGDNSHWYLAETYCTEKSVVLVENAPEKLFVPGNVEVTFTLVKNADGTLTLSYVVAGQPDEGGDEPGGETSEEGGEIKYVVVGNWEAAGNWTPDTSTLVMTEADGRYTWTGTVPAGNYELKVVRLQGSNATWIPDGMGNNITFTVTAESEITVSYDAAEGVKVDGEKVEWPEEEGNEEQPSGDVTYAVLGSFNEWNAETAITMTKNANGTFTAKVTGLAAGEYELKVLGSDGKWYPAENVKVTLTASGEITVTFDKNAGTVTAVASEAGAPTETKPAESKPTESKPAETKPAETKPTETKPTETKPTESKPAETQPAETQPTETKPAEVTEITVYAKVPEDWENPGVWAWNDKQQNAFEAWPGLAMTKGENGWWYAKVPAWVENVIINANGGSYQTADLDLAQLKCDVWVEVTVDANGVAQAELKYASPATGDETALVSAAAVMLFAAMGVVALVNGKKYF